MEPPFRPEGRFGLLCNLLIALYVIAAAIHTRNTTPVLPKPGTIAKP